jgi:stage V sporulation protein B
MNFQSKAKNIKNKALGNLVIKGTLILTITGFATRIIGFYNRIFLSHLIGAKELGIYQLIFPLYMVAFALTTCGNELALTKLVSEYKSRRDMKNAVVFFKICVTINLLLGIVVAAIMHKNALWLCTAVLKAPECADCLRIISIGIPFMAVKGAIHGFFLGLENSKVHGVSDFIEQSAKVLGLYLLSTYLCVWNSYDASFAVWGIVIGEITSFLYSVCAMLHYFQKNNFLKGENLTPDFSSSKKVTTGKPLHTEKSIRLFFKNALPLTTNRLALTVLQSIEAILIPSVLLIYYQDSSLSLSTYGVFTGMAFPFIMFPSTITNSLSTMLLPAVSCANSGLKKEYLQKLCKKSIAFCLFIGLLSTVVFYLFGPFIGKIFFDSEEAGHYILQLSFLCPFIYLSTTLASILNGLGYATHNLILTFIATIIRISFILFFIPKIGITGYIAGLFTSYLFLTFACLNKLEKNMR